MTIKEVDQHLENYKTSEAREGLSATSFRLFGLCAAWGKIRPVVVFLKGMFFLRIIKPKWCRALDIAIAAFDASCAVGE